MVSVVVASHGNLSREIVKSAQMILGKEYENIYYLCLDEEGIEKFKNEAHRIARAIKGDDLIILADIQGGSPFMTCLSVFRDFNFKALTGMNLPMVMEVLNAGDEADIARIADMAVQSGITTVKAIDLV